MVLIPGAFIMVISSFSRSASFVIFNISNLDFSYYACETRCCNTLVNVINIFKQVNMIKDDGTVIHFNNPKVQASLSANTFAITGHAEAKPITEMLPGILSQLGADSLTSLRKLAEQFPRQGRSFFILL